MFRATNAWVGIGNVFNNSVGITYDPTRKLVWALGQRSEVWVLRFDPKTADSQPLQ